MVIIKFDVSSLYFFVPRVVLLYFSVIVLVITASSPECIFTMSFSPFLGLLHS